MMKQLDIPRSEHPRPDFMRDTYHTLNGTWQFAFDDENQGLAQGWYKPGKQLPLSILVPFSYQAEMSGIGGDEIHPIIWFESHALFQTHYARMAEKLGCEMFIAGCEMVMAQRREAEWRALMAQLRADFHGLLSYNTDKYQEENVAWWDAVDVISSSGYYPLEDWENQLNRIEAGVKKHNKPFFFAEAGCMSIAGSAKVPNDWMLQGEPDEDEQAVWYEAMFAACQNRPWIQGFGLWDWPLRSDGTKDGGYSLHNKKAEQVVARHWKGAVE